MRPGARNTVERLDRPSAYYQNRVWYLPTLFEALIDAMLEQEETRSR
jgi:hypothetical protein